MTNRLRSSSLRVSFSAMIGQHPEDPQPDLTPDRPLPEACALASQAAAG